MITRRLLMFRLARRYISRRLLQSILFILGVALGVAVGVSIDLANSSAKRAFNLSAESISGRTTHQIVAGPSGIPSSFYQQVRTELGIRSSAPIVEAFVRATGLDDQPLRLLGVDIFAEAPFRDYLTTAPVEGQNQAAFYGLNLFLTQQNTVLISQTLADRHNLSVSDQITLLRNAGEVEVTIAGLLQPENSASAQALDTLVLADISTAQEILQKPGILTRVDLILPEGFDTTQLRASLSPGTQLTTPDESNNTLNQMTAAFELNLRALSLLALVVGVFLIYNTVTFSVVQRRPVIGIMRSLGTTRRQIFTMILGEATLLGLVGTVLGLALGIIMGRIVVGLITRTISDLYFAVSVENVTVEPMTLITGGLIGLSASFLAALVPSIEATRTPPAGAMRRADVEQGAQRLTPFMTGGAILLLLMGLVMLSIPTQSVVAGFTALFLIVVGCALFTPLALILSMRAITPLTYRLFGVLGRVAPRDVIRSLSRTAVAVAALTVSVSVIVGVGVMIASFRLTVADWLDNTLGADVFISPISVTATRASADLDQQLVQQIAAVEGVDVVTTVRNVPVLAPDYPDLPPVNLAVPSHEISRERRFVWNNAPGGDHWAAMQNGQVLVSEPFAFKRGISQDNNAITLLTDNGPQTFTIAGVYYDYTTDQGTVLMKDNVYAEYYNDPYVSSIGLFVKPDADPQQVMDTLRSETLSGQNLIVRSNKALRESAMEVFERTFAVTVALQFLAVLVAFIGILSALMSLQLEHTREYAVLRANGMTPRQLWQLTLMQTGLMGAASGLLAAPIGLVLAYVLINVINVRSFGWSMTIAPRPEEFALAFFVALTSALLAGLYPAWRLGSMSTTEGLRTE